MSGRIADLNWDACEKCKHGIETGGCAIEDHITISLDFRKDAVICDDYEQEEEE